MTVNHRFAGAHAMARTRLSSKEIVEICETAAKNSETLQFEIRLEVSNPGQLIYSVRNRVLGGRMEIMTFEVTLQSSNEVHVLKTKLLTYKVVRNWFLFFPLPWQMVGWSVYKNYMKSLMDGVSSHDGQATVEVVQIPGK